MSNKIKKATTVLDHILLGVTVLTATAYACFCGANGDYYNEDGTYKHVSKSDSYRHIMCHPAFMGFGENILPWKDNMLAAITSPLRVSYLMPMLVTKADTDKVIESFNYMIDYCNRTGNTLFYEYYTEEDKATDASKADTGLVFLKGQENAPFALICPGGGFINVEANHEGYPVAQILHERGYNVFILRYRVKSSYKDADASRATKGCHEDAAKALQYIVTNSEEFGIAAENYSLWGFSAGGSVAGELANPENEFGYAKVVDTAPAAAILGYPVQSEQSKGSCPLYVAMAKDDELIDYSGVEAWVNGMTVQSIDVTFDVYETGGHGFGTGYNKEPDGWMDKAIAFWEENMG